MQATGAGTSGIDCVGEFVRRAKQRTNIAVCEICGFYWSVAFGVGLVVWNPCWLAVLYGFLCILSGIGGLAALSHEAQHLALLPNRKWNDLVGAWLLAYPVGSIFGVSRAVHLAHHKHLNSELDPDRHFHLEEDKANPAQFFLYYLKLLLGGQLWVSFVLNGFLRAQRSQQPQPAESAIIVPPRKYPEVLNLMITQAVVFSLFWLASGKWWYYLVLWVIPILTIGICLGYLRGFADHARLATDDLHRAGGRLISIPNPTLIDRLTLVGLNFQYHAEHHFFPHVPHYFLPKLHRLMQSDPHYREKYLLRKSYWGFILDYWQQIRNGIKSPA